MQPDPTKLADLCEAAEPRVAGLTQAELIHMGQTIFRWPALGACSTATQQIILGEVNAAIGQFRAKEASHD